MAIARRLATFFVLGRAGPSLPAPASCASQPAQGRPAGPFSWRRSDRLQLLRSPPAPGWQNITLETLADPRLGESELQQRQRQLRGELRPRGWQLILCHQSLRRGELGNLLEWSRGSPESVSSLFPSSP
jgi:hypothetical protein